MAIKYRHSTAVHLFTLTSLFLAIGQSPLLGGEISIDSWFLATGVVNSATPPPDNEISNAVQNPFMTLHETALPVGAANSLFDFFWSSDFGSFLMEATHSLHDVPTHSAFVESAGTILFRSTQDLLLDLSAFYAYQGLGPEFGTGMTVDVVDHFYSPVHRYLDFGETGGPVVLESPSGTFSTSVQTLLPADHLIRISYQFLLDTGPGGTSAVATAEGGLNFTLTAVPEPSSLALLFLGAVISMARRCRQRQKA